MTMIVKVGGKPAPKPEPKKEKEETKEEKKKETCGERCGPEPWVFWCVLWGACAMSLVSSGYSLQRQQGLAERLALLEEQHHALRAAVLEPQQPLLERLKREVLQRAPQHWRRPRSIGDYGDCGCPPG